MTNKEAINYLKETEGYTFSGIDNPKHNEAINLAIKALDVLTRLDGFKYVTTDVFLKEHELAHFDVYKTGWNDAIEAVKKASEKGEDV